MKGNDVKLIVNDTPVAAATNCAVELSQQLEAYTPLPGSTEDDGWMHFRPGLLAWNISSDGFFTDDAQDVIEQMCASGSAVDVEVTLGSSLSLLGDALISEVGVIGEVQSLAKLSIKLTCNNFPSLS